MIRHLLGMKCDLASSSCFNPFTPKSDQYPIPPAASPALYHLECELRCSYAQFRLRRMHWTYQYVSRLSIELPDQVLKFNEREDELWNLALNSPACATKRISAVSRVCSLCAASPGDIRGTAQYWPAGLRKHCRPPGSGHKPRNLQKTGGRQAICN